MTEQTAVPATGPEPGTATPATGPEPEAAAPAPALVLPPMPLMPPA
ncbi:hypothetical protein G3I41_07875, partial [Streptomyces sp. SID9727]|nr:hypothetical protein [Streptomyces sp. SID9727]